MSISSNFLFSIGDGQKKRKAQKNHANVIFHPFVGQPPVDRLYQILHMGRYAGCNHLCKIWCGKIKGFGIYGFVKFWVLPLKWLLTLTIVLRYRTTCDSLYLLSFICLSALVELTIC